MQCSGLPAAAHRARAFLIWSLPFGTGHHNNVTIDWTVREAVRTNLRVMVKRILRKYGYPPDKQEKATQTVLEQAALIAKDWAE